MRKKREKKNNRGRADERKRKMKKYNRKWREKKGIRRKRGEY